MVAAKSIRNAPTCQLQSIVRKRTTKKPDKRATDLELAKKKQFEEAYRLCMKEGDDLYLLRLLA